MRTILILIVLVLGWGGYWLVSGGGDDAVPIDQLPVIRADDAPMKELPDDPGGLEIAGQDNTLFTAVERADDDGETTDLVINTDPDASDQAPRGFVIPEIPQAQEEEFLSDLTDTATDVTETVSETVEAAEEEVEVAVPTVTPDITHDYEVEPVIEAESELAPPSLAVVTITATPPRKPDIPAQQIVQDRIAALPAPKPNIEPLRNLEPLEERDVASVSGAFDRNNQDTLDRPLLPRTERTAGGRMQPIIEEAPMADDVAVTQTMTLPEETEMAPSAPSTGVFYAQLASLPTREGAVQTWERLQRRYAPILSNVPMRYFDANVPGRGTYTRVQVGGMSEGEARNLCAALSAAGKNDGCLILRGG